MNEQQYLRLYDEIKNLQKDMYVLFSSLDAQNTSYKQLLAKAAEEDVLNFEKSNSNMLEIKEKIIKSLVSLEEIESQSETLKNTIDDLKDKTFNKNFEDSLILKINAIKEDFVELQKEIEGNKLILINKIENEKVTEDIKCIKEKLITMSDKKKNYSWLVDLIWKIGLIVSIAFGLFGH